VLDLRALENLGGLRSGIFCPPAIKSKKALECSVQGLFLCFFSVRIGLQSRLNIGKLLLKKEQLDAQALAPLAERQCALDVGRADVIARNVAG
jgi:hypothetical protein